MLKLRKTFSLNFLQNLRWTSRPELSRVADDSDELIHAIQLERENDTIELENTTAQQLGRYWAGVEEDLKKDPSWYDFADE